MNVQSIPDRTSQGAKFDNQVRLPAKERTKARVADCRRFGEIGRYRYWRRFSVRNVPWDDEAVRNPGEPKPRTVIVVVYANVTQASSRLQRSQQTPRFRARRAEESKRRTGRREWREGRK